MKELLGTGFFSVLYNFSNLWLSVIAYFVIAVSFLIQYILLKKCKGKISKWIYLGIILLLLAAGEILSHIIIGWDLFEVILLYGFSFWLFAGAVLASVIHLITVKKKTRKH